MVKHVITYHPKALLDLQAELMNPYHTEFNRQFSQVPRSFDDVLTDLCTHFGIALDGMYSPEDQLALAEKITNKLRDERMRGTALVLKK